MAVALGYGEGPPSPPPWSFPEGGEPGPLARLGRFARANWYGELEARLRATAARVRGELQARGFAAGAARDWRRLVNSGLPERPLALAAGLGRLGGNGLLLVPGRGPAVILGLLLLPHGLPEPRATPGAGNPGGAAAEEPGAGCGTCRACVEACPTGALAWPGRLDRDLCLQAWATRPGTLPDRVEAAWGALLYGCDRCTEACPRFAPDPAAETGRGPLGPGLPTRWLLESPEAGIRARLAGTALGLGWMGIAEWRRNAALAAAFDEGSARP